MSENLRQGVCLFATCSAGHVTTFRGKLYYLTFAGPGPLQPVLSEVEHFFVFEGDQGLQNSSDWL